MVHQLASIAGPEASVSGICFKDFAERVRINQSRLSSETNESTP
jgi:hypothetical protein